MFKTISEAELKPGSRVLVRLDCNVPIAKGIIQDDFRLKSAMQTLNFLREHQCKIIIVSHLENKENTSLAPVAEYFKKYMSVQFVTDPFSAEGQDQLATLSNGEVGFIENIRNWSEEKNNDQAFAEKLASLADVYVNEAFSVSHREHASIVGVPKFLPHYAGFSFANEVRALSKAFSPVHPYLFVLGGAKFETKMPLIKKFLNLADTVFVGGALVNDLLKAKGYEIGDSVCSDKDYGFAELLNNPKILLPEDVRVQAGDEKIVRKVTEVQPTEKIYDIGPETDKHLASEVAKAKMILWNGPVGFCEMGFADGTNSLAKAIAESGAESIVGGGDTLAAIGKLKLDDKFTFLSTAGGAMLDFLANETLVGIEALK